MDHAEIQTRRTEELEALQSFYGDQLLSSLNNNNNNKEEVSPDGPWFIQLTTTTTTTTSHNHQSSILPTLEINLSPLYPFEAPMVPILHNVLDDNSQLRRSSALIQELMEMYEPDMDVGILWAERCREEFVNCTSSSSSTFDPPLSSTHNDDDADPNDAMTADCNNGVDALTIVVNDTPSIDISVRFLSYNHLLHGKSHKKESQLVSTASKMGLVGFVTYGTPGIIGILISNSNTNKNCAGVTTTLEDVVDFSKKCGQIGKKCTILDVVLELDDDGFNRGQQKQQQQQPRNKSKKNGVQDHKSQNKGGLKPLLVSLLGEDKITSTKQQGLSIIKKGLNSFMSCSELKTILVNDHGMDEKMFQEIIGIA